MVKKKEKKVAKGVSGLIKGMFKERKIKDFLSLIEVLKKYMQRFKKYMNIQRGKLI